MARAGILYSHVAKAAAQLSSMGKNPTVDTVREAMGGTGSKSTIAPMLKQWKEEHQGEVAAAGAGVPADLLEAIKGVYERVQVGAQAQVEQMRIEHHLVTQKAAQTEEALRNQVHLLGVERQALVTQLESVSEALAREQAARHRDAVAITALQVEKDGQAQRLADRTAEVREFADQLAQSRRQFEHFQEASMAQRQDDRHAYEARITRAELEAVALRGNLQDLREVLAVLRSEKAQLERTLAEQHDVAAEQTRKLYDATQRLTTAREMISNKQVEVELAVERLDHAYQANERLIGRVGELEVEITDLRQTRTAALPTAGEAKT